jgi:AraC-like DNA-binding protein
VPLKLGGQTLSLRKSGVPNPIISGEDMDLSQNDIDRIAEKLLADERFVGRLIGASMGRLNVTELRDSLKSRIRGAVEQAVGAHEFEATARRELETATRKRINESMSIIDTRIDQFVREYGMSNSEVNRIFQSEVSQMAHRMVQKTVNGIVNSAGRVVRNAVHDALKNSKINLNFSDLLIPEPDYGDDD